MPARCTRFLFIWALLCCFCVLFLSPIISPQRAWAASDPISVTAQTYVIHFPGSIDFSVSARDSASPINKAIFSITIDGQLETHVVNISPPSLMVSAPWHEDTSGNNFHPPGTPIDYYWQLVDEAGNTHTSTTQEFRTIDTRFNWQHLTQGLLQVNWYNRPQDFGQIMLNQASASVNRISQTLGGGLITPINLWIYETPRDFQGSLPPGSYEWVGGQALPGLDEASIAVTSSSDYTLIRDMPHELTHLIFHQLIAHGIYAPTWFDEGLAVYNQTYHEPEMEQTFDDALASHRLLRLDGLLHGFPEDAHQAYLAYAQSWKLLDFMYNTFGQGKMAQLIRAMDDPSNNFNQDLQQALGEDQIHLENAWRVHYKQPPVLSADQLTPTPHPLVKPKQVQNTADETTLLTVIGLVLVLGSLSMIVLIVVYVRRKKADGEAEITRGGVIIKGVIQRVPTAIYSRNRSFSSAPHFPGQPSQGSMYTSPEQAFGAPPMRISSSEFAENPQQAAWPESSAPGSNRAQERPPSSFAAGQEYLSQQARKQAPQE